MDILFLTRWSPTLGGGGTQQRAAVHLRALAALGRVHLMYLGAGKPVLDEEAQRLVHDVVTLRSAGLAGSPGEDPSSKGGFARKLRGTWGVSGWLATPSRHEATALRAALKVQRFDVVFAFHLGSALVADAVLPVQAAVLRIVDWDFIESANVVEWSVRGKLHPPLRQRLSAQLSAWRVRRLEKQVFAHAGMHLCSSSIDVPYLQQQAPAARVIAIENACQASAHPPAACNNKVPTVLFVGTMAYWPNLDAAEHFIDEIWPIVRRAIPAAQLRVVGRAAPAELLQRGGRDGIEVHTNVPDLQPFYERAHVTVVPLRHAVGSNLKIPESMAHARAVVGYRQPCDRADCGPEQGVFAADTAEELGNTLLTLLQNPRSASDAGMRAWIEAHERLALEVVKDKLLDVVRRALTKRTQEP